LALNSLYDLAQKLVDAYSLPVSDKQIERAKQSSKPLVAKLENPVQVDINYDTLVVEGGQLHIYPDVYGHGTSTVGELRKELESSGVDASKLDDKTMRAMLSKGSKPGRQFVVSVESIKAGTALKDGRVESVVPVSSPKIKKAVANH